MLRQRELTRFCDKIAAALGTTTEEIIHSERFEQTVYDMAKSHLGLPDRNFTKKAHFDFEDNYTFSRIKITYDSHDADTKAIAEFYHKYFPETQPQFTYGLELSVSFLIPAFVQKLLPTMKIWRTRPSCMADNSLHYVDIAKPLLKSPLNPDFGSAVFITGADPLLGEWQTASRMTYNKESKSWETTLPAGMKEHEFKFLTGAFDLGQKVNTSQLSFESGQNRNLVMYAPASSIVCTPQLAHAVSIGMRC